MFIMMVNFSMVLNSTAAETEERNSHLRYINFVNNLIKINFINKIDW